MPKPVANWNSARDVWETPGTEGLFCEHLDVYSETFPTSGMTLNGVAYELPTWEPRTDGSESLSLPPTVTTSESTGAGNGPNKTGGNNLRTAVAPLPSPRASEGEKGGPNMRGSKGDLMLSSAVHRLLPTPRVTTGGSMASMKQVDAVLAGRKSELEDCRLELTVEVLHYQQHGGRTNQPSAAGRRLWEDVPLPLPNLPDETASTDLAHVSRNG